MRTIWTGQAIIDAHKSILCSIWLLVAILGAEPEMFKMLRKSDQYIFVSWRFFFFLVFTQVLLVALVASQFLHQEVTSLQSCVGEYFLRRIRGKTGRPHGTLPSEIRLEEDGILPNQICEWVLSLVGEYVLPNSHTVREQKLRCPGNEWAYKC